jgi:pimeloyl-ACP methyl ester carboxylesterase
MKREITLPPHDRPGILRLPPGSAGLVVFAHGSGSSYRSPRNNAVAEAFASRGLATLLFDLLTPDEEADRRNVFDISLLSERLVDAIEWTQRQKELAALPLGLFGASTGAAAALIAAARLPNRVRAVVSRGGRPDLAGEVLAQVHAPSLLVVGGADDEVIRLNEEAAARLAGPVQLRIVPGAGHLFSEPGALDQVVGLAADWFALHFKDSSSHASAHVERGG